MNGPPSATVACSGNWLLGHDRVGPRVLAEVGHRYGRGVDVCDLGTSALALLDHLCGQPLLVIVDACVGLAPPAEVVVTEPDLDATPLRGTSTHQIGPIEALAVARHLTPEKMPQRILLILVETGGLSEDQEAAACTRVVELLDAEIGNPVAANRMSNAARIEGEGREQWQSKHSCSMSKA